MMENKEDCYPLGRLARWALFFVIGVPVLFVMFLAFVGAVTLFHP